MWYKFMRFLHSYINTQFSDAIHRCHRIGVSTYYHVYRICIQKFLSLCRVMYFMKVTNEQRILLICYKKYCVFLFRSPHAVRVLESCAIPINYFFVASFQRRPLLLRWRITYFRVWHFIRGYSVIELTDVRCKELVFSCRLFCYVT